jgi:outer membrane protein assembly factor BamB
MRWEEYLMKKKKFTKYGLVIGIIFIFIILVINGIVIGYNIKNTNKDLIVFKTISSSDNGLTDHIWPMENYDVRHTGRSPYSTADNQGDELWRFRTGNWAESSPVISSDGTIYFGSDDFYAVYPNGTLKWKYETGILIESCPAIDENGVIYIGDTISSPNYFRAIYPNGTLKWKFKPGDNVMSSPVVGTDGTIYFGAHNGNIFALYSNGTLRWKYKTNHAVLSSPAIGDDGTIYCGSHDGKLYALYPNNGTLKWKYGTGDWVRGNPSIGDDGTIYIPSFSDKLFALYPNGTLRWKFNTGFGASGTPTIGTDGTIYVGTDKLYALNPNGTLKWNFNLGTKMHVADSSPAISVDGTIYIGVSHDDGKGGKLIAVNPDGSEKWRTDNIANVAVNSAPAIAEDGTLYICSASHENDQFVGYLHAFHTFDPNAPNAPDIDGQTSARAEKKYEYSFNATDPNGDDIYYYIEWGDHKVKDWFGPYQSGEEVKVNHTWKLEGTYTIKARAKDANNLWGPWGTLQVTIPRNKVMPHLRLLQFLDVFPIVERILNLLR